MSTSIHDRRSVLQLGLYAAATAGLFVAGCGGHASPAHAPKGAEKKEEDEEVSPPEDLMREHGVLNRILLVYEEGIRRLESGAASPVPQLLASATLVRRFVEDYHEKLEEDFLFPRFERAGKLVDLVSVLRLQHAAGRKATDQTLKLLGGAMSADAQRALVTSLKAFVRMYRPHEAREDTVLFSALRGLMKEKEFDELGERFEEKEHALFGKEGFEGIVLQVLTIEQQLGIADLATFTPP